MTLRCTAERRSPWKSEGFGSLRPALPRGALLGFKTELIDDLALLICKKTGNVFQGGKFSPTFSCFQCFVKPEWGRSPLGLAGVMDICGVCEALFLPSSKPSRYCSTGASQFLLVLSKGCAASWCA